jgi:catechol 2,3-dioxygenase-like lactoylglutathione lyase family enzyme
MANALTRGAHHIGLAVRDLDTATRFFCDALGFRVAGARLFHWSQGRRPDDHPGLSDLGL